MNVEMVLNKDLPCNARILIPEWEHLSKDCPVSESGFRAPWYF